MKERTVKGVLLQAMGIVLARCMIMFYHPLAIGYFAALFSKRKNRALTFALMLISLASVTDFIGTIKYSMIMITIVTIRIFMEKVEKELNIYIVSAGVSGITLLYEMLGIIMEGNGGRTEYLVQALAVSILGGATYIIFSRGIDGISNVRKKQLSNEEKIGMVIMGGIAFYYMATANIVPSQLLKATLFLAAYYFGSRYGAAVGAMAGNICGIIMALWLKEPYYMGVMSVVGCSIGGFRRFGKCISSLTCVMIGCLAEYICCGRAIPESTVQGIMIASAVFMILPSAFTIGEDEESVKGREMIIRREGENRLKSIAESFSKLSESFTLLPQKENLSQGDLEHITRNMSGKICASCSKCRLCAVQKDIQEEMRGLVEMADKKGRISLQDMSGRFMMNCLNPEIFINELNHMFEKARMNMVWSNKIIESREVIALQLKQIAGMVGEYGKMMYNTSDGNTDIEENLRRRFRSERIILKKFIILESKNNQREYLFTAKCMRGTTISAKEMSKLAGDIIGISLEPSINGRKILGNEYATISFCEKKNFYALHGTARCTKQESEISGDNFTFSEIGNGQLLMSIADGMGSGYYAFQDSETAIELLEQLMDSGFSEEMALKMINSVMLLNSDSEKPTTLDMGILNLTSGICDFVKLGAASTFVKRDNWVESIKSTTMPMGVFGQVDIESTSKKMYSGDMIIMVSDGIVEAIDAEDKDKAMSEIIMNIDSSNPKEMASGILEKVLQYNRYKADDDMTILVTGVWSRVA